MPGSICQILSKSDFVDLKHNRLFGSLAPSEHAGVWSPDSVVSGM